MESIYVLADGDWNQSAIDSTILAQCRNVGVTYLSEVGRLAETYKYQDGDYVLVAIQKDMEVEEVLAEVSQIMGLQDLEEIEVQEGATSVRFLLSGKQ